MPPIVVDTLTVTASPKRNGLLIFSVQKNKYVYWDSVRVQWSDMAGSSGSYIVAGDTSAMLSPYIRAAGFGLTKSGQTLLVDTLSIATRAWRQKGDDSLGAIIATKGSGTVTSIATGYGINGGAITTTGTLTADTLNIATRSRVQKGIDSVSSLIAAKVNISDTATMLSPYLKESDTTFLSNRINLKVNISDTATMLNPYTRGSGTANFIPKWQGTRGFVNSQIFDDGTNIGIGTTTPTSVTNYRTLQVNGTTNSLIESMVGGNRIGGFESNSSALFVGTVPSLPVVFRTGVTNRARITASGRFLIGTDTEHAQELSVNGDVRISTIDSTATARNMLYADADGVIKKSAVPTGTLIGTGISGYIPKWTGSGTLDTSQIRQVAGDLGIGDAPTAGTKLSVYGKTFLGNTLTLSTSGGFGIYSQHDLNEVSMALVAKRDPLGADTILSAIAFGSNTYQAPARIQAMSSQSWTGGDRGIYLSFRTTPNDSTLTEEAMRLNHDGEMQAIKGVAFKSSSEAIISENYTVLPKDYFVFLPDLEGASRNVVLPTDATPGRMLVIFNTSSDGTYKWSFTGEDVEDAAGAAVTTLTDNKSYTLIYFAGKFRVTAIN
jgi:hypothetical protein